MESGREQRSEPLADAGSSPVRKSNGHPFEVQVLDMDVIASLRELAGDDDPGLLLELVELFLSDAHRRLAEMRLAVETGDLEAVARAAHTLKSSSGHMGAELLSGLCTEIEALARADVSAGLEDRTRSCLEVYKQTEAALKSVEA